jgi:hypothetical protein
MKASPVVCKCCLIWASMIKATRNARLAVFLPSLLFCSLLLVGLAQPGSAQTLKYVFTGTASGTVGDTSFTNAPLTVSTIGDTSTVVFTAPIYRLNVPPGGASFSIGGVGSGTFTDATYVFDNQTAFGGSVGFGDPSLPLGSCCDIIQIHDADFNSTVFASYDLKSPIGPLGFVTDPSFGDWVNVPTSLGPMTVTSFTNVSFAASFVTAQQAITPGGPAITFTGPGLDQSITFPGDTQTNGAAFMAVNFINVAQNVFDSTRLPSEGQTTPNAWSGGTAVPAGTTCTIIKGTGPSGTGIDDTCVVAENLCFDSNHNLLSPTPPSPDSCDIIAPTGPAGNKILLTSHYVTTAPVNQALIIASDGANDWANITGDPTICCTISGGTNGINSDEAIVNLPYAACLLYDPTRAVKSGAVIPIKMYLCDAATGLIDLSNSGIVVNATRLVQVSTQVTDTITDAGSSNPDNDFRFDSTLGSSGGYIFNLKTTGLSKGQYLLFYRVGSDPEHQPGLPFQVK